MVGSQKQQVYYLLRVHLVVLLVFNFTKTPTTTTYYSLCRMIYGSITYYTRRFHSVDEVVYPDIMYTRQYSRCCLRCTSGLYFPLHILHSTLSTLVDCLYSSILYPYLCLYLYHLQYIDSTSSCKLSRHFASPNCHRFSVSVTLFTFFYRLNFNSQFFKSHLLN